MTDTPEMVEWLNRIRIGNDKVQGHNNREIDKAMTSLGEARKMLYQDLNYDITRKQFEGLRDARNVEREGFAQKVLEKADRLGIEKLQRETPNRHIYQEFNADRNGNIGWHFARRPNG